MRKHPGKRSLQVNIILFGFVLTFILIGIVTTVGRQEFNAPHKFALELLGTAQAGMTKMAGSWQRFWFDYVALWDVREENRRLQDEVLKLKALNNEYREAAATNYRLNKLLDLKETLPVPTMAAQIVGRDPSPWFKTIIINRGSSAGIQKGMPVVTVEGIVGQVVNTSPHYAKILLAISPNSAIDALVQKNRVQGIVKGTGGGYQLHYVLKNSEVQQGDQIVTSGMGGIFPKGLSVGKVSSVAITKHGMFQQIEIEPGVDFAQLEQVLVIMEKSSIAE